MVSVLGHTLSKGIRNVVAVDHVERLLIRLLASHVGVELLLASGRRRASIVIPSALGRGCSRDTRYTSHGVRRQDVDGRHIRIKILVHLVSALLLDFALCKMNIPQPLQMTSELALGLECS